MAFNSASFSIVLLFTLLILFNSTSSSTTGHSVSHKRIEEICGQTQNPNFCVTSLEGYLGDTKADLNRLGVVSILLATAQARLNKYVLEQLLQTTVGLDPAAKAHLQKCQVDYDVTLDKLKSAYHLSDQKDYQDMVDLVNDANIRTNDCTIECMQLQNSVLSSVQEDNQKMMWLNNIALVILGMLNA